MVAFLQVALSMLEIYNEQVRDLLNFQTMKQKGGLKVRENPKRGFYGELAPVVSAFICLFVDGFL